MSTSIEYVIPQPNRDIFEYQTATEQMNNERHPINVIKDIVYKDGIFVHYVDADFPKKGFPTAEAVFACNVAKRLFIEMMKYPLLIFSYKKAIESFNTVAIKVVSPYIIKYQYRTPVAQEVYDIVFDIFNNETFANILSTLIQYDDAYRYRIEDIMSETSKEKILKNPRREIKRLIKILYERDDNVIVTIKFKRIANFALWLTWSPKFKRIMNDCLFEKLQYDDADRYWCYMRNDYKYFGEDYETRQKWMDKLRYNRPKQYMIQ